jgi:hypothetical protein
MTKEVLKKMYQLLLTEPHAPTLCDQLESIAREALAKPAQEPVAWVGLTDAEKDGKRVLENGLLFNAAEVQAWELGIDYAEAKLKERNA